MRTFIVLSMFSMILVGCSQSNSSTVATDDKSNTTEESNSSEEIQTVNKHCPIMGGDVATDGGTTTWNKKLIGFCCPGCEEKWDKLSEEDKVKKLAEADSEHDNHDHKHDHDHEKS